MMKMAAINVEACGLNSYVFFLCIKKSRKNYVHYVSLQSHFDAVALKYTEVKKGIHINFSIFRNSKYLCVAV